LGGLCELQLYFVDKSISVCAKHRCVLFTGMWGMYYKIILNLSTNFLQFKFRFVILLSCNFGYQMALILEHAFFFLFPKLKFQKMTYCNLNSQNWYSNLIWFCSFFNTSRLCVWWLFQQLMGGLVSLIMHQCYLPPRSLHYDNLKCHKKSFHNPVRFLILK
jgi:hypothetical protein